MYNFFSRLRRGAAVLVTGVAFAQVAQAQQAPNTIRLSPEDAERGANGPQHNFYFLPPGVGGENYTNAGFFGQKLRPYLAGKPEALDFLNDYRRQKTLFLIDRIVAVGALGLYGQQVFGDGFPNYFNNTQKVAAGLFVTSLLATLVINHNTNQHFQQAVESANSSLARGSIWPRLRPSQIGLGSSATGQPLLAVRWAVR